MKPSKLDEQGQPKKPEECQPNELPLPLFVPLASFARYHRNLADNAPAKARTLAYFIAHHLISKQADFNLPADFFAQLLEDGRDVLLLLDGLDEVANEDERAEVRQSVEELVAGREALAYCDWLNDRLAHSPAFEGSEMARRVREAGWRVALPSELEWEKAARGGLRDAVFAWGDEPDSNRANYAATGIGDTTAVGCFPANGYGLNDLIGNVWEWTRSLWGEDWRKPAFSYPYDPDDARRENPAAGDDVLRVLRGGSWHANRDVARCASRSGARPGLRDDDFGFRVVLRSAPVS